MRRLFKTNKSKLRQVRHARVRATVQGTAERPRLSVFRGLRAITVQLIDDAAGETLCYASTKELKEKDGQEGRTAKVAAGFGLGKLIAAKANAKGIVEVVFDRGGYKYHGRVKAVAEGAREAGLKL